MFIRNLPREKTGLERTIDSLLNDMSSTMSDTEEYAQMVDQLCKLYPLRETDSPKRVSPDTLAIVGGNLLGILMIVGYEHSHIMTSKALNFVLKLR